MSVALKRALAQALLPASILPVLVFGPGLVRAPQSLWRRVSAEVRRLGAPAPSRGWAHSRPAAGARERQGVPGATARREARLLPGVRYAPLRAGRAVASAPERSSNATGAAPRRAGAHRR